MSYEDYPDEFEILKGSLENEDFDRAESVLLMILQRKPDFQQAKLDLERVRGKLGSISNYEFRVRAFLEQGDTTTAQEIIKEASERFTKNRKIQALVDYFRKHNSGGGEAGEGGDPAAAAEPAREEAVLPNLDTFAGEMDEGTADEVQATFRKHEQQKQQAAAAAGAQDAGDAGDGGSGGEAEPGEPSGSPTRGRGNRLPSAGPRPTSAEWVERRARRMAARARRDTVVVVAGAVAMLAVMVYATIVLAGRSGERVSAVTIDESALAADDETQRTLEAWPELDEEQRSAFLSRLLENGPPQSDDVDPVAWVDAVYHKLAARAQDDSVIKERSRDLYDWRVRVRKSAGMDTPIDPRGLRGATWDPGAAPPRYGTAPLRSASFNLLLGGLLLTLVPGVALGAVLAWCRVPIANRLFQALWEFWYALPAAALLFIGVVGFGPGLGIEDPAAFGGLLMGVAMVPHMAFFCRQGFENIVGKRPLVAVGLGAVVVISAALATAARFVAEGVLVIGLAPMGDMSALTDPVHSIGRELLVVLQQFDFPFVVPGEAEYLVRHDVAIYLSFWLFIAAFGLSLIAQMLQAAVAWEGLRGVDPDSPGEMPDARMQRPFSLRNLGAFGLGLIMLTAVAVVLMAGWSSADSNVRQYMGDIAGGGWGHPIDNDAPTRVFSQTLRFAAMAGGIAAVAGFLIMFVPLTIVETRRMRALADCVMRVPTAIPPALYVVFLIGVFSAMNIRPGMTVTAVAVGLMLTPLAANMIASGWEQYRRGPYVRDARGYRPKPFGLWFARVLEVIGTGMFTAAVATGSVVMVVAFGASVLPGSDQFPHLATHLLYSMRQIGPATEPALEFFTHIVMLVGGFVALGFVARVAAEVMARFALARRGPDPGLEDWDG